ncbi:hypothetical protein Tco_0531775 [Tanacetum coccineum]
MVDIYRVLGSCDKLEGFVSILDEGDMAFLWKKVKSGAAVGKRLLLQVIKDKDVELGMRRNLRLKMIFVKAHDIHSSKTMFLYFVEYLYIVNLYVRTTLAL